MGSVWRWEEWPSLFQKCQIPVVLPEPIAEGDCSGKAAWAWCWSLRPLVVSCPHADSFTPCEWGPVTERCAALTTAQHVCYDGRYFTFVLICRAVFGGWGHAACSTASVMAEGAEQRMGQTGGCSTSTTAVLGTACLPVGALVGWHLVS